MIEWTELLACDCITVSLQKLELNVVKANSAFTWEPCYVERAITYNSQFVRKGLVGP